MTNGTTIYHKKTWLTKAMFWVPPVASVGYILVMASDRFRPWLAPHLREHGPLEMATFLLLGLAAILGLWAAISSRKTNPWWMTLFLSLFGFGLALVALEEIAWGQAFFGFDTPEYFASNNEQGETTLHNLGGIHGKSH